MSYASEYRIYQRLNDPEIIAIWTIDEFFAVIFPFFLGVVLKAVFIGLGTGLVLWWVLKKVKAGKSLAWAYGLLHWHFSGYFPSKHLPSTSVRVLTG
ncbi:MAG: type IV conjugative transfer system protein TraL [Sphingomonadales bacterium]|nr:type IV conjugative transfer system protein TraL [Sphingomonadales bacterium]